MKLFVALLAISCANSFETTTYPKFENLTDEEIQNKFLGLHDNWLQDTMLTMFMPYQLTNQDLPESFSWTDKMPECVHRVMNQGKCGSCWAFSSSEVVSDRFCIQSKGKINEVYSPQHLVDCDLSELGCMGGFITNPLIFYSLVGA